MVIFDLDGTLTPVDSLWNYIHTGFGTTGRSIDAAKLYRNGKLSYKEWAEADAECWRGILLTELEQLLNQIPYRAGAIDLFRTLRNEGVKTGILSAGLSILATKAERELGADFSISNELLVDNGRLTGEIKVKVSVTGKMEIVKQIAEDLKISLSETALVGDRYDDLMLPPCLRVAFNPKDASTRQIADFVVEEDDLTGILNLLN